jgi:hypothetical protein
MNLWDSPRAGFLRLHICNSAIKTLYTRVESAVRRTFGVERVDNPIVRPSFLHQIMVSNKVES